MTRGTRCGLAGIIGVTIALGAWGTSAESAGGGTPPAREQEGGWTPLFDGRSLAGWRTAGTPGAFQVSDGMLVCGADGQLTAAGPDGRAIAGDVELSAEVFGTPGGSAIVSMAAAADARAGHARGIDVVIQNGPGSLEPDLAEARTGSLRAVRHVYKSLAADGRWFTLSIAARRPAVQVRVDGTLVVDYRFASGPAGSVTGPVWPGGGSIALQCLSSAGQVRFRNLRVRPLGPAERAETAFPADPAAQQILDLTRAGFPVIDLHAHLKGSLTLDQVLALSRRTGMFLGLAVNCGKGFPIESDAGALAFLETMKGQPVFIAMQAEGREWVRNFSRDTMARFDYVFTDGMTWTNPAGRRMRLWMPDEVEIGPDEQAFMDLLVSKIVGILNDEPIDIYVNPTFLPAVIASRYDELWTEARMSRVIDAAVRNRVAIEINARYKIPSERFLRLAKAAGATFTFGTNNASEKDLGDWSYPLEMQRRLGLTRDDMFVPGRQPSRSARK